MKNTVIILLALATLFGNTAAISEPEKKADSVVVKSESESVFKGLLYRVWGRLRAFNPQLQTNKTRKRSVATMGVRGSETTTSIIEPYWKGDKTSDPVFIESLTEYTRAQELAEKGDLKSAVSALDQFIKDYEESELVPNAQFALAISQAGMGDVAASIESLQTFIEEYPDHPLVSDARQVIKELR